MASICYVMEVGNEKYKFFNGLSCIISVISAFTDEVVKLTFNQLRPDVGRF